MIVALNPGHAIEGAEHWNTVGFSQDAQTVTAEHAREMNRRSLQQYQRPRRGQDFVFHRKSVALAHALLWLIDGRDPEEALWARCWFTDAFKCSTKRESGPRIPKAGFVMCRQHLSAEIEACNPKIVVALGTRAFRALSYEHAYPVVRFRHPSNGCPKLHGAEHNRAFAEAAALLGVRSRYDEDRFVEIRRHVHERHFRGG